jgi:Flp pilus assembly protein TadD
MKKNNSAFTKVQTAMANGQYVKVINLCQKLLLDDANNIDYLLYLGEAQLRIEQFEDALKQFARVVELDNQNIRGINNFGAALLRNNQYKHAIEIYEYGLELDPKNYDFLVNICNAYQGIGQPEKSLQTAMRAIELQPNGYMAYNNLGTALGDLLYLDEARQAYMTAMALNPGYLISVINLAQLEVKHGDHATGLQHYESALKNKSITPSYAELIKYYMAHSMLHLGVIDKGWDYYEFGFSPMLPMGAWRSTRKFKQPQWNGRLDSSQRILIWREQGLGDEIMFSTCLHELANAGLNVTLECDPRLVNIYQRTYPEFAIRAEQVNQLGYPRTDDFDVQCPIGSLTKYFRRSFEDFERKSRSWVPESNKLAFIKSRLAPFQEKVLVGICWSSGNLNISRNKNYTNLIDWKDLLTQENLQFVNLHYGQCEEEILEVEKALGITILRWPDIDLRNDLEAVLALASELDCVCTVGTAVSSIAGSSGTPTLLLMQRSWTLLGQTEHYPWYPNIQPFAVEHHEHVGLNIQNLKPYIVKRPR